MFEVWWDEEDTHALRAKFASLGDALRFVWRYGHEGDARIRLPNGGWKMAEHFDVPLHRVVPPEPGRRTPTVLASRKRIAEEITRRLGVEHSRLVERVVSMTIDIIVEQHTMDRSRESDPRPASGRRWRSE